MSTTLKLDRMTVAEKLQAIELLWESLRQNEDDIPAPQWHKDLLDQRAKDFKEGKDTVMDWETAKKWIENEIA